MRLRKLTTLALAAGALSPAAAHAASSPAAATSSPTKVGHTSATLRGTVNRTAAAPATSSNTAPRLGTAPRPG